MSEYAEHKLPSSRREPSDLPFRIFALSGLGVLVLLVLMGVVIWFFFRGSMQDQASMKPVPEFPAPSLQRSPPEDMSAFLKQQMAWLNSTGWIDKDKGIVHIPIHDAMKKIADQGIPDWPKAPPSEVTR